MHRAEVEAAAGLGWHVQLSDQRIHRTRQGMNGACPTVITPRVAPACPDGELEAPGADGAIRHAAERPVDGYHVIELADVVLEQAPHAAEVAAALLPDR